MPRVFVVNVPMLASGEQAIDVRPAARFGELVHVFPPGQPPLDPGYLRSLLEEKLEDYGPDDFLLPVGNVVAIVATAAYAADRADGRLKVLHWHGRDRDYVLVRLNVFNQEPENTDDQEESGAIAV